MVAAYRVTVYRQNIARLYARGGDADRFNYRVSSSMISAARRAAPNRTGSLAAAHRIARNSRWGNAYQSRYTIENVSPHAEYVHEGTRTHGSSSGYMILGAGGPGRNTVSRYAGQFFTKRAVRVVKGQQPNPWLEESCTKVAMRYGAVIVSL